MRCHVGIEPHGVQPLRVSWHVGLGHQQANRVPRHPKWLLVKPDPQWRLVIGARNQRWLFLRTLASNLDRLCASEDHREESRLSDRSTQDRNTEVTILTSSRLTEVRCFSLPIVRSTTGKTCLSFLHKVGNALAKIFAPKTGNHGVICTIDRLCKCLELIFIKLLLHDAQRSW